MKRLQQFLNVPDSPLPQGGKTILCEGWKEIDRKYRAALKNKPETDDADSDTEKTLPPFTEGQTFEKPAAKVTEHDTTPPKPHNEASLLSAMEHAGSEDTDPDAERKGLGTPATRAAVIEKLVKGGFVERKGKQLLPTKDGIKPCVRPTGHFDKPAAYRRMGKQSDADCKRQGKPRRIYGGYRGYGARTGKDLSVSF